MVDHNEQTDSILKRASEPVVAHPIVNLGHAFAPHPVQASEILLHWSNGIANGDSPFGAVGKRETLATARLFLYVLQGKDIYERVEREIGPYILSLVVLHGTSAAKLVLQNLHPWSRLRGFDLGRNLPENEAERDLRAVLSQAELQFRSAFLERGAPELFWLIRHSRLELGERLLRRHEVNWFRFSEIERDENYAWLSTGAAVVVRGTTGLLPLIFCVGWLTWTLITRLPDLLAGSAFAATAPTSSAYVPPLGLSQWVFTAIVCAFAAGLLLVIGALTWKGYFADKKSTKAATVVEHFTTLLLGVFFGTKL